MIEEDNRNSNTLSSREAREDANERPVNGVSRPFSIPRENLSQDPVTARPNSQPPYERGGMRREDELHFNSGPSRGSDPLVERFSQLRASSSPQKRLPYPNEDTPPSMPSHTRQGSSGGELFLPLSHVQSAPGYRDGRPAGPRAMPGSSADYPPHPPKVLLEVNPISSLPRAPSPTYSPARNIGAPSNIMPPRSTVRSISGSTTKTFQSQGFNKISQHQSNGPNPPRPPERPNSTIITAEDLHEKFRSYNVLIIDVRSREEFDEGHILAKSIVCIDPLSTQWGISYDEQLERLLYSPEHEISLLERISDFDLVVYHDQGTTSDRFLYGPPKTANSSWMRALHDTLFEFNDRLPLKRRPVVLLGGIEAWIDLVGLPALQSSDTLNIPHSQRAPKPPKRPVHRMSLAGGNTSREIRMRRLRDYEPLNAEEEREWREKARREEVEPANIRDFQVDSNGEDASRQDDGSTPMLIHSFDDFFRRFPEPSAIPTSMVAPRQETVPARFSVPTIPSRPPPAVSRPSYSGVTEREASQISPGSRQPSSAQPPLYTSRFYIQSLKLPRTGLINFSVTCYMNATIQCLIATIPLSGFFLEETWRNFVQKNWKGSNGILPEIFASLVRGLWRNELPALRPVSLRKFCTRLNPEWGIDRQQDAKEFFDFLVDCLHEDLNIRWNRNALEPLSSTQELNRENMPINIVSRLEWDRYTHREQSFISSLFAGQHLSQLRCTTCRNTSTTYEAFYSISVEIPRSGTASIKDCLQSYCQEEMLSGEEEWKCPKCRCQREASKRIRITRLPQILVIHFKRFSASKTESAKKVHTPIDFPLHGLNMEPYMANTRAPPNKDDSALDPAITPPFSYDAYGVMRHIGSTGSGGHYISLVRDAAKGVWRKFDDDRVSDFDPSRLRSADRLQNEQAYIVFYERARAR